jgi:hypothetical protein
VARKNRPSVNGNRNNALALVAVKRRRNQTSFVMCQENSPVVPA